MYEYKNLISLFIISKITIIDRKHHDVLRVYY